MAAASYPSVTPLRSTDAAAAVAATNSNSTIIPTESDVLFGRGMNIQRHKGNVLFRQFLEGHVGRYYEADNVEKIVLIDFLFRKLQESGVRFLRHEMSGLGGSSSSSTFGAATNYNTTFETAVVGDNNNKQRPRIVVTDNNVIFGTFFDGWW